MEKDLCRQIEKSMRGKVEKNEPMSAHTSFGIGGPADIRAVPQSLDDLVTLLELCTTRKIPYMIVGRGTNLLVRDGGIRGIVISLDDACGNLHVNETRIRAGAGISLNALAKFAARHDLQGLEFLVGIPGCVGGGLAVNAGAWGNSLADVLESATLYDPKKREVKRVYKGEIVFGYRTSNLPSLGVILEAAFEAWKTESEKILGRMKEYLMRRADTQPVGFKSAGCIFKNPPGYHAGALIDALGFKGYAHGGAMVSDIHANFIINTGSATAADVLAIVAEIKRGVLRATGIDLEEEIEIVGRD
jgi:UDP-N-acetylmuramate dehydrogenase